MKVYKTGRRPPRGEPRDGRGGGRRNGARGGFLRAALLALLVVVLALLAYLVFPFGEQRVVLLGSDARAEEASRSDTIVVAKVGGGMLAVPRDTLVEIPGVGEDKINAAFAVGGPELTVESLENLTGVPLGDYVVVDFGGVQDVVDAMGGVTVEVEEPIRVGIEGRRVFIPAGTQELDGFEALAYVRYRGDPTADIGRIGRQQKFLREMAQEATSPEKLPRLPATALALWRNIETDMSPPELARFALRMRLSGIGDAELYPGVPQYIGGISYWVPDRETGERVVGETLE